MNAFTFLRLIYSFQGKRLPNLNWIEDQGLLAVKISQHFALRIDFLNPEVCAHLARLYTRARPLNVQATKKILDDFSADWKNNFTELSYEPFATASVGQVHIGKLKTGTSVIVKIRKADWAPTFRRDILHLQSFFRFILFFYPKLERVADPLGVLDAIEAYTLSELEFLDEIKGAKMLEQLLEEHREFFDLNDLKLPHYHLRLSSNSCLVVDKIEGKTFDELLVAGKLPYETLLSLFRLHGFFLFVPGIFHGDIHPGNIILAPDNSIHFIDTGALGNVEGKIKNGLFHFMEALCDYNFMQCGRSLQNMSTIKLNDIQYKKFEIKLLELYKDFPGKTVSEVSLTRQMMETIKLSVNSGMQFERGLFGIIKSMMYLDGMVLRCKPDAILLEDMRPAIRDFRMRINQMKKHFENQTP